MDDLTTERSLDSQATRVVDVLGYFLDMLSKGVCTTRRWQTSARLVQELNVCIVPQGVLLGSSYFHTRQTLGKLLV